MCKIRARSNVEVPSKSTLDPQFQEDEIVVTTLSIEPAIDDDISLVHPRGGMIDIDEDGSETNEDVFFSDDKHIDIDDGFSDNE